MQMQNADRSAHADTERRRALQARRLRELLRPRLRVHGRAAPADPASSQRPRSRDDDTEAG